MINHLKTRMTLCSAGWETDSLVSSCGGRLLPKIHQKLSTMCRTVINRFFVHVDAHRVVLMLLRLQVQSSDVVLDVAVEHGLPELHGGPHHVLLYAAVGKLSDACAQFLPDKHRERLLRGTQATSNV